MTYGARTREQVEYDVLASMILVLPFRDRALDRLTAETFTTSEHRRIFRALRVEAPPEGEGELFVSRMLGVSMDAAKDWLLDAIVTDYDADLVRLLDA